LLKINTGVTIAAGSREKKETWALPVTAVEATQN
jgi:hypothetical protein